MRIKLAHNYLIPEVEYIKSNHAQLFTIGLKAYCKFLYAPMKINRGYFNHLLEMFSGLSHDQAAELLLSEYDNGRIKWER